MIFPNYILLPESKYLYKNIQRKQRVIDNQQEMEQEQEQEKKRKHNRLQLNLSHSTTVVFNSLAVESILNLTETSTIRKMMGLTNARVNPSSLAQQLSVNDSISNDTSQSLLNLVNILTKVEALQNQKIKSKTNCALRKSQKNTLSITKHPTNQGTINVNGKNNNVHVNSSSMSQSKSANKKHINNHSSSSPKKSTMLVTKGRNYKRAIYTSDISGINKMNSTSEKENKKLYYNTNQVNYSIKTTRNVCTKMNHTNTTQKKQNIETYTQQENKTIISNTNQSKHSKHNSHQIKKGLITMLLSSNAEAFKKSLKDKKLKIQSTIPTHNHCPTTATSTLPNKPYYLHQVKTMNTVNIIHNKLNIPTKPQQLTNPNNNNSKSARPSSQTKSSISMAKLTNKILGFISKINTSHPKQNDTKTIINNNGTTIHNNGLKNETQSNNNTNNKALYPLTSREEHNKLKFNQKSSNNNFTTTSSTSISHKKTFTSSSLGTAAGSLNNNNNFQPTNEEKIKDSNSNGNIQSPVSHIPKSSFKPITHRNDKSNQVNLRLSNDLFMNTTNNPKTISTQTNVNLTIKSPRNQFLDNPNNKILKTYSHFQSNSTLVGTKDKRCKSKKSNNEIIPINDKNGNVQTPSGVKGIKIKGFDEIIEQTKNSLVVNSGTKNNNGYNKTSSDRNEKKRAITNGNNVTNTNSNCKNKVFSNNTSNHFKPKTNRSIQFKK